MALKTVVETLEDLESAIAALYIKQDDGTYRLDVEPSADDTGSKTKDDGSRIPKARLDSEILKRRAAEDELKMIAEDLRKDVPEEFTELVPDLPPGKLIPWLRSASAKGLFNPKAKEGLDSKRPNDKKPADFTGLSPQAIMATGYKTK